MGKEAIDIGKQNKNTLLIADTGEKGTSSTINLCLEDGTWAQRLGVQYTKNQAITLDKPRDQL